MMGRREATSRLILSALVTPLALRAKTARAKNSEPLWASAQVLIGHSSADQNPSPSIICPLFFANGHPADATHALDLSEFAATGNVKGNVAYHDEKIEPDFGPSIAMALAQGTDGPQYLLVAGEGQVTGGTGYFAGVTRAIVRCKYKVTTDKKDNIYLIACLDCALILIRV